MQPNMMEQGRVNTRTSRDFDSRLMAARKRVYNLAYRMLGNSSDAEDVTQETLVRAWSRRASYDPTRSFDAWITRIATNLSIDQMRRRRSRAEVSLDTPSPAEPESERGSIELTDLSQNPEQMLMDKVIDKRLQRRIASLPAVYRQCIQLLEQEHTYQEIADMMHCPLGTVRSRMHRARIHLSRGLEAGMIAPGISGGIRRKCA